MKKVIAATMVALAALASTAAQATSFSYLAGQGFEIKSVVRYGIDGEREIYLQRGEALFVCWIKISAVDQAVTEQGCRQLSPAS